MMKWRNQNKNPNRNNQTLDSFLTGINSSHNSQSTRKTNVVPKIKIPHSSGLEPLAKPLDLPFMYPQYPEFREYQYSIALKCIVENTLVCLPTGLGKTHIASVLMLNFHRWFPEGLIFFLAPTKPLVDQQSMSLSNFTQFAPKSCIFSLTGSVQAPKRVKAYELKRILFCTPQTLENDLMKGRLDPKRIVLLIIDQAHKATGNYSYANIVRFLDKQAFGYRLIGLSATPGNDKDRIQQVIQNLQIANMIVKSDEDEDVKKYIKRKIIEPVYIPNTSIIREVQQILQQFISWPINQLLKFRLFDRNLAGGKFGFNSKCFFLINNQINQRISQLPFKMTHMVISTKCFLKFLADSLSLLREAGYQSFKRKFIYEIDQIEAEDGQPSQKTKIHQNFLKLVRQHPKYKRIKQLFQSNAKVGSHPKLDKLRQILHKFLSSKESLEKKSKVIIFANLRYTCHQIHKYLSQEPYCETIKSQIFLGQSKTTVETRDGQNSTTETLKLSQKQQVSLIKKFKSNQINTLISTSIGEQGLDIGEVDAIFCYEGGMSTIRMVQRMGRTGRKRDGSVFVLLMEGKQAAEFDKANLKTQRIKKTNAQKYKYYSFNPVLFEELTQIPIHFFAKPPEEPVDQTQSESDKKQKSNETKRKIKVKSKIDTKGTKKKEAGDQTLIKQASKSQQQDESSCQNTINQSDGKKTKEKQLFKIKGNEHTMVQNSFSDGLQQNDDEIKSIQDDDEEEKLDLGGLNGIYDQETGSQYSFNADSLSIGTCSDDQNHTRRVYDKFDNLFAQKLFDGQQEEDQKQKINGIINKHEESSIKLNKEDQKEDQGEQNSENSELDELFLEYNKVKNKKQQQLKCSSNEKNSRESLSNIENVSQSSSQIIDQQERQQLDAQENVSW